jgi:plastocyanin
MPIKAVLFCVIFLMDLSTTPLLAASLTIKVTDSQQLNISDAVIELLPVNIAGKIDPPVKQTSEMSQKNRTFVPFVLAVPKGTHVDFPNLDRTRHHVYSFSEAKPFELKLYIGKTEAPILFDTPGLVALGCNIHDYMQAFIYVADSPFVAVTDNNGELTFADLPQGQYQVKIWHPWQTNALPLYELTITAEQAKLAMSIDIEHQEKPSAPAAGFGPQTKS